MNQFFIFEIIKNFEGEFTYEVHSIFDENTVTARLTAESEYYQLLSEAALSSTASHSVMLITSDGEVLASNRYIHSQPEPKEEDSEGEVLPK